MKHAIAACLTGAVLAASSMTSFAAEPVSLMLNWQPGGDHSPIFYALEKGWYKKAGIDLAVRSGQGSGMAAQNVGVGASDFGITDLPTAFVAMSKGANLKAVMVIYANTPFTFYWKKSSGIKGPKDFPGHTIGNPPGDAARVMWPAFAQTVGIKLDSVKFVNLSPAAKVPALAADRVDIISDFYNGHDVKLEKFGKNLGFVRWSQYGINPYGNSFVVNGKYLKAHPDIVANFVRVTQRAYAACVKDSKPCIDALMKNASGLNRQAMVDQWRRVKELMTDKYTSIKALGYFAPAKVQKTYDLVAKYFHLQKSFDPKSAYTDKYLHMSIKMPKQ
ncbi:MAG: ABC transporter substrate-binding protein [Bradyrhizobium sp.]